MDSYIPDKVTDALAHQREEYNNTRWDDVVESEDNPQGMAKILRLHLLLPHKRLAARFCKTVLSAAILDYPPPTLIVYGASRGLATSGIDAVQYTYKFLIGKEVHDNDLMMVVGEGLV
jgi:hypothetical protein